MALVSCHLSRDIRQWVTNELDKSKSKDIIIYTNANGLEFTAQSLVGNENNEIIYLPSNEPITATTFISYEGTHSMDVALELKNEADLKYFKGGTLPTLNVTTPTGGKRTDVEFQFELVAHLDDNLTAEGKSIEAELVYRRSDVGDSARDFKRVPFTIFCNSPPPELKNVQLVKNANTGNIAILFNLAGTDDELRLLHRDLKEINALGGAPSAPLSDDIGFSTNENEGLIAPINYNGTSFSMAYASEPTNYEVFTTGTQPQHVTKDKTIHLETSVKEGQVHYQVFLQDEQGLTSSKTEIQGNLKKLLTPFIQEEGSFIDIPTKCDGGSTADLIFSEEDGTCTIKLMKLFATVDDPETYSPRNDIFIKYSLEPVNQPENIKTLTPNDLLNTYQIVLDEYDTYTLKIWQEATGYANSEIGIYNIKLDPAFRYISETGDDTTGTGSRNKPYKTLQKAIEVLNEKSSKCFVAVTGNIADTNITFNNDIDNLTIKGAQNDPKKDKLISGNSPNTPILNIQKNHTITIKDITLDGSDSNSGITVGEYNGNEKWIDHSLTLTNCIIENCNGSNKGSAIHYEGLGGDDSSGKLTIENTTIQNNSRTTNSEYAGAVQLLHANLEIAITNSSITGNTSTITGNNTTVKGIGLYLGNQQGNKTTFTNTTISNNTVNDQGTSNTVEGGGIYFQGGTVILNDVTFENNAATALGQAVFVRQNQDPYLAIKKATFNGETIYATMTSEIQAYDNVTCNITLKYFDGQYPLIPYIRCMEDISNAQYTITLADWEDNYNWPVLWNKDAKKATDINWTSVPTAFTIKDIDSSSFTINNKGKIVKK